MEIGAVSKVLEDAYRAPHELPGGADRVGEGASLPDSFARRCGIPRGMVSLTAWYPSRHGIPRGMVSLTAWYPPATWCGQAGSAGIHSAGSSR